MRIRLCQEVPVTTGEMILDFLSLSGDKSKITAGLASRLRPADLMILELSSLLGIKSKITTKDLVPEETGYA